MILKFHLKELLNQRKENIMQVHLQDKLEIKAYIQDLKRSFNLKSF